MIPITFKRSRNNTSKILGLTILAPFFITSPAPRYPPAILQSAAAMPITRTTCQFIKKIIKEVILVVKLITFACALAVFTLSLAKTVNAMIKKVPVPGP